MTAFALFSNVNSYSNLLRIVNAVVVSIASRSDQLTDFPFFSLKLLIFGDDDNCEDNNDETKDMDGLIFGVFRLHVLLPNSMSKLIHNRCTRKLIITITAA